MIETLSEQKAVVAAARVARDLDQPPYVVHVHDWASDYVKVGVERGFLVPACVATDDGAKMAMFDAAPWLAAASKNSIEEFFLSGSSSVMADSIAFSLTQSIADIKAVFAHQVKLCHGGSACFIETHVDVESAHQWMTANRSYIYEQMPFARSSVRDGKSMNCQRLIIPASLTTNDGCTAAYFDATAWFERAGVDDWGKLMDSQLGRDCKGDFTLMEVAEFFDGKNDAVSKTLRHIRSVESVGFDASPKCLIDYPSANEWLNTNPDDSDPVKSDHRQKDFQ